MDDSNKRKGTFSVGYLAAKVLADCAAAMERKASGASKAGMNLEIGCAPPAAEATEGDRLETKAVSPRSQAVGAREETQANGDAAPKPTRGDTRRGPPGGDGECGRGFRNQADAGECLASDALARDPARIRTGTSHGRLLTVRAPGK